jgi:MOSC domain-containing protein YiiM
MEVTAHIVQVSSSPGGVPKLPMESAEVDTFGIKGDGHDSPLIHGGPERALCIWSMEVIEAINAEGHHLFAGAAGDNVTVRGLDWAEVVPGSFLKLGESVVCMITGYTAPCKTNQRWFAGGDFNRMGQKQFPGSSRVYARIIEGGTIRPGDAVQYKPPQASS